MKRATLAIIILGFSLLAHLLGGSVAPPEQAHLVSQRFVYTPEGCSTDWPQYAKVCHFRDSQGNHIIHTFF